MSCEERIVQLSALLDGELAMAELAELTAHLAACPDCARRLAELGALSAALANAVPEEKISADFLARIEAALDAEAALAPVQRGAIVLPFQRRVPALRGFILGAAAAAVAANVLFTSLKPPGNIVDLAAVRDTVLRGSVLLTAAAVPTDAPEIPGYKLASARSDIVAGHAARVLAYATARQSITLCIWKANGEPAHAPREGSYRGMNIVYWNDGSEEYWVASSLPVAQIEAFGQLVRNAQG
jgi:anti-sigma factor RsiW